MPNHLPELFREVAQKYGDRPAFFSKDETKNFRATTYEELYEHGLNLAEALVQLGVSPRENVGLLADNRLEWILCDYGIQMTGAADVPRGTDITDSEMVYILNHSAAKVVFVEHDKMLEKFKKNRSQFESVEKVIVMDKKSQATDALKLYDLLEKGKELRAGGSKKAEERIKGIKPDDLFTMIYTSGTTGMPKGVMLMHSNMMHQVRTILGLIRLSSEERILSILPVWHVFERVFEYLSIGAGAATYYTNVRDLRDDMRKVKPTFMGSAPRLWESIYNGLYSRINDPKQTNGLSRLIFKSAYFISKHHNTALRFIEGNEVDYTGRNIIVSLLRAVWSGIIASLTLIPNIVLDWLVLGKIREATGGELKASVSGGGALQRHVDAFFNDIGIQVLEGYGMTETSPVISMRTFTKLVPGSVGIITPETELQIRDDHGKVLTHIDSRQKLISGKLGIRGVIHIKGPQVMKGYYKNPEATAKVLKEGWMDTGDIGMINFNKTLTITGRAKDTVVLLGGENVEPVPIENKITESPYVFQCMVVGQDQKNLGAIIVPEFDELTTWAKQNGITDLDKANLVENPKVLDLYKKEIKALNNTKTGFKAFEQVTPFFLVAKPFEVGEELTNLLKMKRHVITEKYKDKIAALYEGE